MSTKPKYNQSETVLIKRSQINFAPYNPKKHSKEQIAEQRRNIKRVGFLGGIVWNEVTGNLVSGHKRTMSLDLIHGYDGTPGTDYDIKVEKVQLDEKTEKEQNVYMDAPGTNTQQDADLLALMLPDIDYKSAGLTDEDVSLIGIDYLLRTEEEGSLAKELEKTMSPVNEQREEEKEQKQLEKAAKIAHMKEVKAQVKEESQKKAEDMDAYLMLSFDNFEAKAAFMERFGYGRYEKFIKGETFSEQVERVE